MKKTDYQNLMEHIQPPAGLNDRVLFAARQKAAEPETQPAAPKRLLPKKRRPVLALADLPETAAEPDSGAAELWDAVARLPEKLRIPIHLYYAEGYSTEEIAGLLDIPAATVRTRLRRARNRLRDTLEGDDHEEERLSEYDGAYPAPRRAE